MQSIRRTGCALRGSQDRLKACISGLPAEDFNMALLWYLEEGILRRAMFVVIDILLVGPEFSISLYNIASVSRHSDHRLAYLIHYKTFQPSMKNCARNRNPILFSHSSSKRTTESKDWLQKDEIRH
jgi:hypothetical protein